MKNLTHSGKDLKTFESRIGVDLLFSAALPGRDDAAPFRKAHIPSVTVHSLNRSVLRALRAGGTLPHIQREEYSQTYRMLCAWHLDKHLE